MTMQHAKFFFIAEYLVDLALAYRAIWLWASEDCGQNVDGNDNDH